MSKPVYFIQLKINEEATNFCIENSIIGVGWGLKSETPQTIDEYEQIRNINNEYAGNSSLTATINAIKDLSNGGYIWTKDYNDNYYLCFTNGEYEYCAGQEKYDKLGIAQYLKCKFYKINVELVPKNITHITVLGTTGSVDDTTAKLTEKLCEYIDYKEQLEQNIT